MIEYIEPATACPNNWCIYSADSVKYKSKPTDAHKIKPRLGGTAAHKGSTIQDLAKLMEQGVTIQGAQLRDKSSPEDTNTDKRLLRQQIFYVDIDNDQKQADGQKYRLPDYIPTPAEILSRSRAAGVEPAIIAPSFSSGKVDPNGDIIPKYHVVYISAEPFTDSEECRRVIKGLQSIFGAAADTSCSDPARILYGTTAEKTLTVQAATNPPAALLALAPAPEAPSEPLPLEAPAPSSSDNQSEALAYDDVITEEQAAPRRTRSKNKPADFDPDVLLSMIPAGREYNGGDQFPYIRILAAFKVMGGSKEVAAQWAAQYHKPGETEQEARKAFESTWKGLNCKGVNRKSLIAAARNLAPAEFQAYQAALTPSKSTRSKSKRKTQSAAPETETQTETAAEQFGGSQTVEEPAGEFIEPTEEEQEENRNPYDKDRSGRLTCANLENALELMGITVRHNIISHKIEYTGRGLYGHDPAGLSANLPYIIYNKLQKRLQGCTVDKIAGFLNVIAFSKANEYNPVLEAISATKWDGRDHLEELYNLMQLEPADNLSRLLLKKWLMQAYCGLHNTLEEPFSLDLILVLVGRQGFGKTRLLEKLALNSKNFGEGLTLDPRDKDSKLQVTSFWLAELGEIGSTMKKDIDTLKAFISLTYDENRPPYSRGTVTHPRRTSYCGTTNDMQFLIDTTGNRRFAVVKLPDDKYIDVRGQAFKQFNALQLWAQIADIVSAELAAGETYASAFRLTREELAQLETRNHLHSKPLKGEEEVRDELYFLQIELEQGRARRKAMTASQFIAEHGSLHKYTAAQIGKVLTKMGFKSMRKKVNGVSFTAYELPSILLTREEGANLAEGLE